MATLSLQDVLAVEPSLVDKIDSMTELIPGVPASKQNLKTLLEHVIKEGDLFLTGTDDTSGVKMHVIKKNKELWVKVMGKAQEVRYAHGVYKERPCVCNALFKCTEEGLLEGLIYAKHSRKRYRDEGPCPDCVSSDETRLPRKKLKAMGMPKCAECMLTAIVS